MLRVPKNYRKQDAEELVKYDKYKCKPYAAVKCCKCCASAADSSCKINCGYIIEDDCVCDDFRTHKRYLRCPKCGLTARPELDFTYTDIGIIRKCADVTKCSACGYVFEEKSEWKLEDWAKLVLMEAPLIALLVVFIVYSLSW